MRIKVNPLVQPNDTTLNWYGSGDVKNDNIVNGQDLTRLTEVANGTYSNPSDKRLRDRCDVNGDEVVNSEDLQILAKKVNGLAYLPGEWNLLLMRAEQIDWLKKMLEIDKTNTTAFPGGNCVQYDQQTLINFHGISLKDIPKFLEVYPYDFTYNGRFNLPLLEVGITEYDSEGKVFGGHAMNTIILRDNALVLGNSTLKWTDLCNIEPQNDKINVQPGEALLYGINSTFDIGGPPPLSGNGFVEMPWYFNYSIKNNIPTFIGTNPDIKIITQRGK